MSEHRRQITAKLITLVFTTVKCDKTIYSAIYLKPTRKLKNVRRRTRE